MNENIKPYFDKFNTSIINFRGIYSLWSKEHNISYNEMLVLYTIRDNSYCTQKQICNNYLLPRQTINNVIKSMKEKGLITISDKYKNGKEKSFVLTKKGQEYSKPFYVSLEKIETKAINNFGEENLKIMAQLIDDFNKTLKKVLMEK